MAKRIQKTTQLNCFQNPVHILFLCPRGEVSSMFEANQFQSVLGEAGIANNEVRGRPRRESVNVSFNGPLDEGVGDIGSIVRMTLRGNITIDRGASHPGEQFPPDSVRRQLMTAHAGDGMPLQDETGALRPYDYVVMHDSGHYRLYAETAAKMHHQPTVLNYEDCTNWAGWHTHLDVYRPLIELIVKGQEEKGNSLRPITQ
ncbi:MAG: hypothetical protein ABH834_02320 [Candidatus Altiarchaeota archaeon]